MSGKIDGDSDSVDLGEKEVVTACGYTSQCKPAWMQRFSTAKYYLVTISMYTVIQGFSINGVNNVNMSSYERRYHLSSRSSGLVASMYDVVAGLTVLFVGYFGGRSHQPRLLGFSLLSLALGTFIMALAHFTAPLYEPTRVGVAFVCQAYANGTACIQESDSYLKNYLYILLLGQSLNGFAGTCLYTVGVTYLDESVNTKSSPLYLGIMNGCAALGPALGYIVGGYLLSIYVDVLLDPPNGLTPDDPAWVGAWWIGFAMASACALTLAFFLFCFPQELPATKAIRAAKISEAHDNGTESIVNSIGFGVGIRDMPRASWFLLKNPPFISITIVLGVEMIMASGFSTFLPKFIANQFGQTSSWAAMLTGFMAVPGAALGSFLGGYFCKRFNLQVVGIFKMIITFSVTAFCLFPVLWARCDDTHLAGVVWNYPGDAGSPLLSVNLSATCNAECHCDTSSFMPVCADGIEYFTPCHAGCTGEPMISGPTKTYSNCLCPHSMADNQVAANSTLAVAGKCPIDCSLLYYVFIPFCFLMFLFTFMMATPMTIITLRVVPANQRAFAVGFQWVFLRFIGSIPGPILFGAVIDSSCDVWQDSCGEQGACWFYDNFEMAKRLFIIAIVLKSISIVFTMIGLKSYKRPVGYKVPVEQAMETVGTNEEDDAMTVVNSTVTIVNHGASPAVQDRPG